jgi:cell fate (sporulation/competence/biofilm development) regulator YlbF (YheA/YmcA/DUF963 family)
MDTNVSEDVITQKTRELCEAIVQQSQFHDIRRQVDSFMGDAVAQQQYESLSEKGRQLHQKQQQGLELAAAEISAFDQEREVFFSNPVAKGFVDAQEAIHNIQEGINKFVGKTFELGRVPAPEELECDGDCGHDCDCHH